MFKKNIIQLLIIGVVIGGVLFVNSLILAWTAPTAVPPGSNVSTPLNVSATAQTKAGSLRSSADMRAPTFYDSNNAAYYANPAGLSIFNDLRTYDDIFVGSAPTDDGADMYIADKIYDWDNTGYYINPASVSRFNDIRPNIMYDGQNTAYYVDPAGTSKFSTINLGGVSKSSWPSGAGIISSSIKQNGYIKFDGGLIMQWGRTGSLADPSHVFTRQINFPRQFPNNAFSVTASLEYHRSAYGSKIITNSITKSGFKFQHHFFGGGGPYRVDWVAFGN